MVRHPLTGLTDAIFQHYTLKTVDIAARVDCLGMFYGFRWDSDNLEFAAAM